MSTQHKLYRSLSETVWDAGLGVAARAGGDLGGSFKQMKANPHVECASLLARGSKLPHATMVDAAQLSWGVAPGFVLLPFQGKRTPQNPAFRNPSLATLKGSQIKAQGETLGHRRDAYSPEAFVLGRCPRLCSLTLSG